MCGRRPICPEADAGRRYRPRSRHPQRARYRARWPSSKRCGGVGYCRSVRCRSAWDWQGGPMKRGARSAKAKVVARPPVRRKSRRVGSADGVQLKERLAETLEQHAAISEILQVISASQRNVQPVFDTIAAAALKLCNATTANLVTFDGQLIHLAAFANLNPEVADALRQLYPRPPGSDRATPRAILTRDVVAIPDVDKDAEYVIPSQEHALTARGSGFRSILSVPLIRDETPIGAITVGRPEPGPFSDRQIALLKTFADQAVIAIENVRLFNETREALERQRATSEVLGAISGAQTDALPVFETIARNAHRLSGAVMCNVLRYDGTLLHIAASYGFSPEDEKQLRKKYPVEPGDVSVLSGRVILSGRVEQIDDVLRDPLYDQEHAAPLGLRRMLGVPMLRDGAVLGVIVLAWRESGQTPAALMELLKTFADQAVIAIENVRLFNETKEALEQQRASGDVLATISSSIADTTPVFEKI